MKAKSLILALLSGSFSLLTSGHPEGLAISGNDLFVANYSDGTIGKYDATTGAPINAVLVAGLTGPYGLAISGNDLYVANFNGNTIGEYDATTGLPVNALLVIALNEPTGIALSGNSLYVANQGSGIIGEYDATTGLAIDAALVPGLSIPTSIAVEAVPEPSAGLLCGMGALALVATRRRKLA